MKHYHKICFILFFSLALLFPAFAQRKIYGEELSSNVFNSLTANKLSPKIQHLVNSGNNRFPYNVYLYFEGSKKNSESLVLIFCQEDFIKNEKLITEVCNFVRGNKFDFDLYLLFSYGNDQIITKDAMIFGSEVFIAGLTEPQKTTIIEFNFDTKKNEVITSSNGKTAPSWLIKNEFNILKNYKSFTLPRLYLSQLYQIPLFYDNSLNMIFENDATGIKLKFKEDENLDSQTLFDIIAESINSFADFTAYKNREQHFFLCRLFGRYRRFSEGLFIRSIIIIISAILIFLVYLGFINKRLEKKSWENIKKIWYTYPSTVFTIYLSVLLTTFLSDFFVKKFSDIGKIYFIIGLIIGLSFVLTSIFYTFLIIKKDGFGKKSADFIVVAASFFNLILFLFINISIFPIFLFIFCISVLSLKAKNDRIHIILFLVMTIPYIIYSHILMNKTDTEELRLFLLSNETVLYLLPFILAPLYLMFFRILTSLRGDKVLTCIVSVCVCGFIAIFLILYGTIRSIQINERFTAEPNILIKNAKNNSIDFSYSDRKIFGETLRTLKIKIAPDAAQCDVRLYSEQGVPLLYSDNEYSQINDKTVVFKIPDNPPEEMIFTYGTQNFSSNVSITALYRTEKDYEFEMSQIRHTIGEK